MSGREPNPGRRGTGRGARSGPAIDEALRRPLGVLLLAGTVVLIPWTLLYLTGLPERHTAAHWNAAWIGFDLLLAAALGVTAWAALRGRQILIPLLITTATLLVCDAWFDVVTALGTRDEALSIAMAVVVELPLAAGFLLLARRLFRDTLLAVRPELEGVPLRRVTLPPAPERGTAPGASEAGP